MLERLERLGAEGGGAEAAVVEAWARREES